MARHRRAERRPAPPPVGAALPRRAQHSRRTRLGAGFRQRPARQPGQCAAGRYRPAVAARRSRQPAARTGQPLAGRTTARRCASGTRVAALPQPPHGIAVDGEAYDAVIIATAPQHAGKLWPALAANYDYEPIATVYLQFEAKTSLAFPLFKQSGKYGQWVVDRGDGLLACVLSGHGDWEALADSRTRRRTVRRNSPCTGPATWHKVIREKRATFACRPGIARPDLASPDIRASCWPATTLGPTTRQRSKARYAVANVPPTCCGQHRIQSKNWLIHDLNTAKQSSVGHETGMR